LRAADELRRAQQATIEAAQNDERRRSLGAQNLQTAQGQMVGVGLAPWLTMSSADFQRPSIYLPNGQQISAEQYQQLQQHQQQLAAQGYPAHVQQQQYAQVLQAQAHAQTQLHAQMVAQQAQAQQAQAMAQQQQSQSMANGAFRTETPNGRAMSSQQHYMQQVQASGDNAESPSTEGSLKRGAPGGSVGSPVDIPAKRAKMAGKRPSESIKGGPARMIC
jgi:hypothetical protein